MEMLARNGLTLFFPMMFPFDSPECFQGDEKGTLGRNGLKQVIGMDVL